jgi:hypothetical protein
MAGCGVGMVRHGRRGAVWHGGARQGAVWQAGIGVVAMARLGKSWPGRHGNARQRMLRRVNAELGRASHCKAGKAQLGATGCG